MDETEGPDAPAKPSKLIPLAIGMVGAAILGGAAFFVAYSGMLGMGAEKGGHEMQIASVADVAFVPIEPIIISLSPDHQTRHLRFRAELEVAPGHDTAVETLMPRIVDVLNGYLRAVDARELEHATSLVSLRAQLLRRIQLVVGEGLVRDLLVTEFVLN